ncbi:Uncharacterised protein [Vibrio cholerae]|uniref:Uncharacterized protein n=1 Tax=Vibrio cholerae TaxID=666 RepID=A0A655Q6Z7_VIBCL|nr:Uncharacterised protein [Vibrio cholerae]CSA15220.1 Uncharacterised protein [Vibrio cholerae]CSA46694.1 Uncharacterised protein [Vibrio cholerae]CSA49245.1 Uncharacterised protein [Vibrio cholerae]CSA79584.1 Uncharacterised protein [Vibrio cholerae]
MDLLQANRSFIRIINTGVREATTVVHNTYRFTCGGLQRFNHLLDFFGRRVGTLTQHTNFISHDSKTTSLLTRTGSFNGRIQRQ